MKTENEKSKLSIFRLLYNSIEEECISIGIYNIYFLDFRYLEALF